MPLDQLIELFEGRGIRNYSYLLKRDEDEKTTKLQISYLQGRFEVLSKEERAKAIWKQAALLYADYFFGENWHFGRVAADACVGVTIGSSGSSLKRWRKSLEGVILGSGYWHLILAKSNTATRLSSKVWLKIQDGLVRGLRPSEISKEILNTTGDVVSMRTIQRVGKSENEAGRLHRTLYVNRFK
jgi:hypothetical protein